MPKKELTTPKPTIADAYKKLSNAATPLVQDAEPQPEKSQSELRRAALKRPMVAPVLPANREFKLNLNGIGDRTVFDTLTWNLPRHGLKLDDASASPLQIQKRFRAKLDEERDLLNSYYGHYGIIEPEYNLLEPYTIIDTESYLARAIERKCSLMFRNGIAFTGENQTFVEYAERRAGQIGYVMEMAFEGLLKEIVRNLYICSNVLLVKIRDNDASGGRANPKNGDRTPVAGYEIVPPYTMYPYLKNGRLDHWRRFFGNGRYSREYPLHDVIHFKWDVKPGHLFGTPRITPVRDDIFALRRLEENIELLLLHHLFPLFHVAVGTEEHPCEYYPDGTSEITQVANHLQNMSRESVLITDERAQVAVHGVGNEGADFNPVVEHYKKRIFTGLGVSGIDLGEADSANRSTAENVSQNLRDAIKADLKNFCEQFQMLMLKEWFLEAPFNLSVQNAVADVNLEFHELDPDGQIKGETHNLNLYNNNAITHDELRKRIKHKPLEEKQHETETNYARHTLHLEKFRAKMELAKAAATETVKTTKKGARGASTSKSHTKPTSAGNKLVQQIMQPMNQHGRNLDPHKARSARAITSMIYDELLDLLNEMQEGTVRCEDWATVSSSRLDLMFEGSGDTILRDRLKDLVRNTTNADTLYALISSQVRDRLADLCFDEEEETESDIEEEMQKEVA